MGVFPSWFFLAIGSMYAIYIYIYIYIYISMVTWIPSIYPLDLSIFLPAPWIRHGNGTHWPVREAGPGLTELTGLGSGYKFATPPSPNLEKLLGTPGDATGMPPTVVFPRNWLGMMSKKGQLYLNAT